MKRYFIPAILMSVIISSCTVVRYHKTSSINKQYSKLIKKSNSIRNKASKDYKTKKGIYTSLVNSVRDKKRAPYPKMKSILDLMLESLNEMNNHHKAIVVKRNEFKRTIGRKKKIKSNEPAWKKYGKINDAIVERAKIYDRETRVYTGHSKNFIAVANDHSISKINTKNFSKKLNNFNSKITSIIKDARNRFAKARKIIADSKKRRGNKEDIAKKERIVNQMEKRVNNIDSFNSEIRKDAVAFKREAAGRKQFYAGPGMVTHEILKNIKSKASAITLEAQELKRLANEVKK